VCFLCGYALSSCVKVTWVFCVKCVQNIPWYLCKLKRFSKKKLQTKQTWPNFMSPSQNDPPTHTTPNHFEKNIEYYATNIEIKIVNVCMLYSQNLSLFQCNLGYNVHSVTASSTTRTTLKITWEHTRERSHSSARSVGKGSPRNATWKRTWQHTSPLVTWWHCQR